MNAELVNQAVGLFVDTLPLETTDISTESYTWHDLYSKECKLFELMRTMGEDELSEYRNQVLELTRGW